MKTKENGLKQDFLVARRFFGLTRKLKPGYLPLAITSALFQAATPFLNVILPKFILDELMGRQRLEVFLALVCGLILGNGALNAINRFFTYRMNLGTRRVNDAFLRHMGEHVMRMDLENLEDPDILDRKEQALQGVRNQGGVESMCRGAGKMLQAAVTIAGLAAIVVTLSPLVLGLILVIVAVNSLVLKRLQAKQFEIFQSLLPLNRKYNYYWETATNFTPAKDVRVYDMTGYLMGKYDSYAQACCKYFHQMQSARGRLEGLSAINLQLQMALVYGYMALQVLLGRIGIGDFSMYIAAANSFSTSISTFMQEFIQFRAMCRYLKLYLDFIDIPAKADMGGARTAPSAPGDIEFRNVWFRYPRSQDYVIQDLSLTIHQGEKLSIVGQNGAGKTTMIKLLCRLYEPERGQILLNGVDIREYGVEEYRRLLAVVFQDYKLFSLSVGENLAPGQALDRERGAEALEKAGLGDKIARLPRGLDTSLYKDFDPEGMEFSGGEAQKLALARAIYRDAPVVILDEPTAALDPYAEMEIYARFDRLIERKTAVYISHRLSSCRFCDHVAVFDQGRLVEYGSHDQLVAKGGKYAALWQAQAQYYCSPSGGGRMGAPINS